jgi:coenzyme F420-dependent glucose-6-phosphate dehydrogenase
MIAAEAEGTKKIRLGQGLTVPVARYHPAIIAQAFATIGLSYPGRSLR